MTARRPDLSAAGEPIAIIGMACRFPGANDIEAFWRLLETGKNAVAEGVPGSGVGRWGQLFGDKPVQSEGCRWAHSSTTSTSSTTRSSASRRWKSSSWTRSSA